MRELLVDSYPRSSRPLNWRLALIENWNYASRYLEPPEYFIDRVRLWRAGDGRLLSFLIRYHDAIYLQVDRRFRDLEAQMLAWAEANWVANDALQTTAFEYDVRRQNVLMGRGYSDLGPTEYVRLYDLGQVRTTSALPRAFRVASVGELGDIAGRIRPTSSTGSPCVLA